jgi:hypothetical protein
MTSLYISGYSLYEEEFQAEVVDFNEISFLFTVSCFSVIGNKIRF